MKLRDAWLMTGRWLTSLGGVMVDIMSFGDTGIEQDIPEEIAQATKHCCNCGYEWLEGSEERCPRCHRDDVATVAECIHCQAHIRLPRSLRVCSSR